MRLLATTTPAVRPGRRHLPAGRLAAVGTVLALGAALLLAPATAGAQAVAGTITVSPPSGPVGTLVHLHGTLASPGCQPAAGVVEVDFEALGQTTTGGVDETFAPLALDGSFATTYQVPSALGGTATRGLFAYPVVPGAYQFQFLAGAACMSTTQTFTVTGPAAPSPSSFVAMAATPDGGGYWLAQADGGVRAFGDARSYGSLPGLGVAPGAPVVSVATTPDGRGYWLVDGRGDVYAFGDARFVGSLAAIGVVPFSPIAAFAPSADGHGYWLVGSDGGVFAFGDARFAGPATDWLSPYQAVGRAPHGGFDVVSSHLGQLWQFPSGTRLTSVPDFSGIPLAASLSSAAVTPSGEGAWQVGLDGGVFAFGDARYRGSLPQLGVDPAAPVVGVAGTPSARGYWLLGSDGGVFAFGDARYYGSGASPAS